MAVLGTARARAPVELSGQLQVAQGPLLFETGRTNHRTLKAWKAWGVQALRYCRALAGLIGSTASMMAFVFTAWSVTADLSWTSAFPGAGARCRTGSPGAQWERHYESPLTGCDLEVPPGAPEPSRFLDSAESIVAGVIVSAAKEAIAARSAVAAGPTGSRTRVAA